MSVTHGQCDARTTVTFPACAGTVPIILFVIAEAHVCEQLAQECTRKRRGRESNHTDIRTRTYKHVKSDIISPRYTPTLRGAVTPSVPPASGQKVADRVKHSSTSSSKFGSKGAAACEERYPTKTALVHQKSPICTLVVTPLKDVRKNTVKIDP